MCLRNEGVQGSEIAGLIQMKELTKSNNPMQVEYRAVPGFLGYRVGSDGSVWSCRKPGSARNSELRDKWKPMSPGITKTITKPGYRFVVMWINGTKTLKYIAPMVLELFVGPAPDSQEVRHMNGISVDDRLDNLCWGTRSQNILDKRRHGTSGTVISDAQRNEIRKLHREGMSQRRIAAAIGIKRGVVQYWATRRHDW